MAVNDLLELWRSEEGGIRSRLDEFCQSIFEQDNQQDSEKKLFSTDNAQGMAARKSVGIVFFTTETGKAIPLGVIALHGNDFIFQYHPYALNSPEIPPISDILPKRAEAYITIGLHPFFDNLLAEGQFADHQRVALGQDPKNETETLEQRYYRLLIFGRGTPGAVSMVYAYPDPNITKINDSVLAHASISGIQQGKLLATRGTDGKLHPNKLGEDSTHIIKLYSAELDGIIENEFLSYIATGILLPNDDPGTAEAELDYINTAKGRMKCLAIKRFDRTDEGGRIHVEDFSQLMGINEKFGPYANMADKAYEKLGDNGPRQLYSRIVCQFLLGNTDNHYKNFSLFNRNGVYTSFTPMFDLVQNANIKGRNSEIDMLIPSLKPHGNFVPTYNHLNAKVLLEMGHDFGLTTREIVDIITNIQQNIPVAKVAIMEMEFPLGRKELYEELLDKDIDKGETRREIFCRRMDERNKKLFGDLKEELQRQAKKNSPWYRQRLHSQNAEGNHIEDVLRIDESSGIDGHTINITLLETEIRGGIAAGIAALAPLSTVNAHEYEKRKSAIEASLQKLEAVQNSDGTRSLIYHDKSDTALNMLRKYTRSFIDKNLNIQDSHTFTGGFPFPPKQTPGVPDGNRVLGG